MAANGEREYDGRDRRTNYYSETVVIPSNKVKAKATTAKKAPAKKNTSKRGSSGAFTAPPAKSNVIDRNRKIIIICACSVLAVLLLAVGLGTWWYLDTTEDDGLIYSNVYALDIDLGGMTPDQARAALLQASHDSY